MNSRMIKTTPYCDRCSRVTDQLGAVTVHRDTDIRAHETSVHDLCAACVQALDDFLRRIH